MSITQYVKVLVLCLSIFVFSGCASLGVSIDPTNTDECWNLRHILANSRTSYDNMDIQRLRALWKACEVSYEANISEKVNK